MGFQYPDFVSWIKDYRGYKGGIGKLAQALKKTSGERVLSLMAHDDSIELRDAFNAAATRYNDERRKASVQWSLDNMVSGDDMDVVFD